MYQGKLTCIQSDFDDINYQIQITESRKENHYIKHEVIPKSLGKMVHENGENIPPHDSYLLELTQENLK